MGTTVLIDDKNKITRYYLATIYLSKNAKCAWSIAKAIVKMSKQSI